MEETQGSESSFAASLLNRLLSHHRHVQKEALREVLKVITTGLNAESFKIGQYKRILRIVSNYFVSDVDNGEERASYLRSILIAFVKVEAIVYSEEMSLVLKELLDDSTYTSVAYTRKLVELVLLVSSTGEASWVFPHLHNITFRFLMDPQGKPMDRKHWVQSKLQKISTEFVEKFANYCLSNANNTVVSMLVLQDIIVNADVKASIRQVIKDHLRKRLQGVASKLVPDPVNILWTSLLRSLSSEEWSTVETTEGFESLLLKSIKKSPESFSAPASFILSSISSDLNTSYLVQQGIVGLAIRMLKSEDLQVKNAGISILTNTYGRIKDSDAITLFVNQIVDSLNGKFPGVATVSIPLDHHKLAILTGAIAALSKGNKFCDKVQTSKAYSSSLATLKAYFEKEKDANLQLFAGVFLANVMKTVLVADDLSVELRNLLDYFFAELEKSVTVASSSLKSSILFFLSYALSADDNEVTAKTLSRFGTTSLNIVKETMKKSNFFSFDTILALHVLSTISQYEVSLHESMKLAKLSSVLTSSSSFLYHETFSHYLKRSANNQASSVIRSLQDGKVNDLSPAVMVSALTFRQYVQGVITVFLNGSIEDSTKVFGLLESSESSSAFYSSPIATVLENGVAVTAPKAATSLFSLLMLFAEELNLADVVREKISKTNFNKASLSLCFVSGLWNLVNTVDRDLISEHKQSLVNYKAIDESIVPTKTFAKSVTANKLRSSLLLILSLNDEVTIPASHACSLLAFTSFITAHPLVSVDNVNATKFWRYKLIPMLRNYFNNIARSISNDYKFAKSLIKMVNHTAFTSNHYNSAVGKTSLSLFSMFFLDDIIKRKSFNNMNLNQIFFSHFVADMSSQLEVISQQLSTFSEEEISVYLNPQAAIEKGVEDAKSKVSDSVPESSNADRKKAAPRSTRKGGFGNDVVEDRDWAEKIKKEKAAKMLSSVEASQGEVMTARVQEICQNVVGVLEQMKRLWTLLEGLILLDVTMARQFLFVILSKETVWSLLSSNLVGDNILASMKVIYKRILEESLIDSVEDFIASVRITYLTTNLLEEKELPNVILRTLRALQLCFNKTTANDVIQATTFFLCFPCIAKIIEIGNSEAVANAFSVLEK